jgi:thioesterase domain-containing protein
MSGEDIPRDGMTDEQFARLKDALEFTRAALAIAAELDEDITVFFLKNALHSLNAAIDSEAEGIPERETVELTVYEAEKPTKVTTRRRRWKPPRM